MLDGDFSDEEKPKFFPAFEPIAQPPAPHATGAGQGVLSARRVYDLWAEKRRGKLADDTLRRYKPTLYSLSTFSKDRDVRQMTGHSVQSVGRKYEHPDIEDLAEAMAMFPRYDVTGA